MSMRVLIAPTAFKGTLTPAEVARAMEAGVNEYANLMHANIYIDLLPIADGGDGTIESLSISLGGKTHQLQVSGALDEKRTAQWLELDNLAVVELASACGIAGLKLTNAMAAHTRGLGSVIKNVLETANLKNIVVALGGSASTDGGTGALYELGAKFFDSDGQEIVPAGGQSLFQISKCDLSPALAALGSKSLSIATDVDNQLLGKNGAAAVFGPQKGATRQQVIELDAALEHFADVLEKGTGNYCRTRKGAGAAGGTAFGLATALNAKIISGFFWLSDMVKLRERIAESDLVISGEGKVDESSVQGKVIGSINELCRKQGKPLFVLAGKIARDFTHSSLEDASLVEVNAKGEFATADDLKQTMCILMSKQAKI